MHGIHQTKTFFHPAFTHEVSDSVGDVHKTAPIRHFEPEVLRKAFHASLMPNWMAHSNTQQMTDRDAGHSRSVIAGLRWTGAGTSRAAAPDRLLLSDN